MPGGRYRIGWFPSHIFVCIKEKGKGIDGLAVAPGAHLGRLLR